MREPIAPTYILGLDLGQANDYTALIVAEVSRESPTADRRYDLRQIQRVPLNTRYPEIVRGVAKTIAILRGPTEVKPPAPQVAEDGVTRMRPYQPPKPRIVLVVDYTGVGRPVLDMLLMAGIDCPIIPVTIVGGERVKRDETGYHVPKRDLASVIQRLLQERRLKIPMNDRDGRPNPESKALVDELVSFRVKISLSGHDSYGAGEDWRSGAAHDDLVLATALACWYGESEVRVSIT